MSVVRIISLRLPLCSLLDISVRYQFAKPRLGEIPFSGCGALERPHGYDIQTGGQTLIKQAFANAKTMNHKGPINLLGQSMRLAASLIRVGKTAQNDVPAFLISGTLFEINGW